ncbi:hypothetical protein C492_07065 [Natronococcus jeotgali DSM 18795]|uniref:Uncharacterized protein n=1 Tax=Natronococcus jeotgali DSM 18795 TaxID=1227498 RepID=L9XPM0_9EURY|nr:hypothetical protein C492_07065 [Natronococcus jeotgali DSM 18795]
MKRSGRALAPAQILDLWIDVLWHSIRSFDCKGFGSFFSGWIRGDSLLPEYGFSDQIPYRYVSEEFLDKITAAELSALRLNSGNLSLMFVESNLPISWLNILDRQVRYTRSSRNFPPATPIIIFVAGLRLLDRDVRATGGYTFIISRIDRNPALFEVGLFVLTDRIAFSSFSGFALAFGAFPAGELVSICTHLVEAVGWLACEWFAEGLREIWWLWFLCGHLDFELPHAA